VTEWGCAVADLRERVARALAREFAREEVWFGFLTEADAVLAELGQPQAEPVAWQYRRNDSSEWVTLPHWPCLLGDGDERRPLYAAPQPQADALTDALSSLDFYKRRCELLQECQKHMRDGERTLVCDILANGQLMGPPDGARYAPQPQADNGIAAELRDEASRQVGNNYADELRDLLLRAAAAIDAAPQPQAPDAAALAKRLDKVLGCHADSMPKEAYFEVDAVMRALYAAPQPQASAEDVALVGKATNWYGNDSQEAWQRIRASLGVGK
jgi:hypothetical protein